MIDISQWRASIGGWNSTTTDCISTSLYLWCPYSPYSNKIPTGLGLTTLVVLCGCQVMMSLSLVLGLMRILMLSGDIELNPGPGNPPLLSDVFRLLKPHSTDWDDIGRALEVPRDFRKELLKHGLTTSAASKLEDVLAMWIESQCSEVSWDHLIEVLLEEKMADTVSKIQKYLLGKGKKKYQWNAIIAFTGDQACMADQIACHSLPSCVTRYSYLLKQKYSHQTIINGTEWPPRVGKDYYGRLLLLDRESRDVKTEQRKIWNIMRGNVDVLPDVTQSKIVDIPDVLKPNSFAIVLIDGPPGVGKTTFCRKLLNMWAKRELPTNQQQRYTVALYCSLRDKRIVRANTLTDIMKTCYDNREVDKVVNHIEEHHGAGLLIIFDGWDELSTEHRESSLAVQFICREILLKCTVIVTSRSYASESIMRLNENFKHFEVIGFDKSEVHKVITETLHDDGQLASDLCIELERETNIESLCYIPLVCSMVILVYKDLRHLPLRLTELYELFVLHTVKRHVEKSSTVSANPKRIQSLKQIPDCVKPSFDKLSFFAYLSLKENNPKMTFSLPELQKALDVSITEGYIGLMTTVSVYDEELYQFPHLTIQEFLAAWWIASNDGMDVKAFEEHFEDDHFRMCLRFVAGLTGLKNEKFMEIKYLNAQLDFRCSPTVDRKCNLEDLYCSHTINRECNMKFSKDIPQRILHLLFECQNSDLCNHVAITCVLNRTFCFQRLTWELINSFDYICMLFFLRKSGLQWNKIHLYVRSHLKPVPLKKIIMADNSTDTSIECKELVIECEDADKPPLLHDMSGFLNKVLSMYSSENVYYKYYNCYHFIDTLIMLLKKPQVKKICLFVYKFLPPVNVELLPSLKDCLEATTTLEELMVEDFHSNSGYLFILSVIDGLMRNKSVKSLTLGCPDDTTTNTCDTRGHISGVSRKAKQLLQDNTTLEEIQFSESIISPDMFEVNAPLQSTLKWSKLAEINSVFSCKYLQSLTIDTDPFPQSQPQIQIAKLFDHLPNLNRLSVHFQALNTSQWIELFTILQTNQTLKELRLSIHHASDKHTCMTNEVFSSLKCCLTHNKSIKHLDISEIAGDTWGMSLSSCFNSQPNYSLALSKSLSCNETIEHLSLLIPNSDSASLSVEDMELLITIFSMDSLVSLDLTLCSSLYPAITSLLQKKSRIKELIIHEYDVAGSEHRKFFFEFLQTAVYNHPTLEYTYIQRIILDAPIYCDDDALHSERLAEKLLHQEQISSLVNNKKLKTPPLIAIMDNIRMRFID